MMAAAPGAGMLLLAARRNGRADGGVTVTGVGALLERVSRTITTTAVTATASAITESHRLTGPNFWTGRTTLCNRPSPSANPLLRHHYRGIWRRREALGWKGTMMVR